LAKGVRTRERQEENDTFVEISGFSKRKEKDRTKRETHHMGEEDAAASPLLYIHFAEDAGQTVRKREARRPQTVGSDSGTIYQKKVCIINLGVRK